MDTPKKQKLFDLLAEGKSKEVIQAILDYAAQSGNQKIYEEAILLSNQFEVFEKSKRQNLITKEQEAVRLGQINNSLLQLINEFSRQNHRPSLSKTPPNSFNGVLIIASLLILFSVVGWWIWSSDDSTSPKLPPTKVETKDPSDVEQEKSVTNQQKANKQEDVANEKANPTKTETSTASEPTKVVKRGVLEIRSKTKNLGKVAMAQQLSFSYNLKNIGNKTIKLTDIAVSCNCIIIEKFPRRLAPNESGKIELNFTADEKIGRVKENIKVTGDFEAKTVILALNAEVIANSEEFMVDIGKAGVEVWFTHENGSAVKNDKGKAIRLTSNENGEIKFNALKSDLGKRIYFNYRINGQSDYRAITFYPQNIYIPN